MKINIKINPAIATAIGSGAVAMFSAGYAIAAHRSQKKLARKLETSLEALASTAPIDIPESLIREAVAKKVDMKVAGALTVAADKAVDAVRLDIHSQVREAVAKTLATKEQAIEEKFAETVNRQITTYDVGKVKNQAMMDVSAKVREEMDDELSDILSDMKENAKKYADKELEDFKDDVTDYLKDELKSVRRTVRIVTV